MDGFGVHSNNEELDILRAFLFDKLDLDEEEYEQFRDQKIKQKRIKDTLKHGVGWSDLASLSGSIPIPSQLNRK